MLCTTEHPDRHCGLGRQGDKESQESRRAAKAGQTYHCGDRQTVGLDDRVLEFACIISIGGGVQHIIKEC